MLIGLCNCALGSLIIIYKLIALMSFSIKAISLHKKKIIKNYFPICQVRENPHFLWLVDLHPHRLGQSLKQILILIFSYLNFWRLSYIVFGSKILWEKNNNKKKVKRFNDSKKLINALTFLFFFLFFLTESLIHDSRYTLRLYLDQEFS